MEKEKKNQHKPAVFFLLNLFAKRSKLQKEGIHSFNACHQIAYLLMPNTVKLYETYYLFILNTIALNMAIIQDL